jgi:hypothetical protein
MAPFARVHAPPDIIQERSLINATLHELGFVPGSRTKDTGHSDRKGRPPTVGQESPFPNVETRYMKARS